MPGSATPAAAHSSSAAPRSEASSALDCEALLCILERGWLTFDQLRTALAEWRRKHLPLGEIACRRRRMTMTQVFTVLDEQAGSGELFGAIAVRRGYLKPEQLEALLAEQIQDRPPLHHFLRETGRLTAEECRLIERRLDETSDKFPAA